MATALRLTAVTRSMRQVPMIRCSARVYSRCGFLTRAPRCLGGTAHAPGFVSSGGAQAIPIKFSRIGDSPGNRSS